ncbi:MAG TPA: TonB-dependent receptor plug domain-containing protein, partial [Rhizomicrobium sp.]
MKLATLALSVCATLPLTIAAQAAEIETVVVTASALPGTAIDPNQIPTNVQTLSSADLSRLGSANALRTLSDSAAGVSLTEAQDNPFQPNLFYRGFEASPLAGDAQGLVVYADGVRLNQPFGDVVNWDLLPDIAIDALTVEGSNPVFGLNALGGAISVQMKNGFRWQGAEAEALGGSFGHAQTSLQYGQMDGASSLYVAASVTNDDGWRDHSPSHVAQGFADFGWRGHGA